MYSGLHPPRRMNSFVDHQILETLQIRFTRAHGGLAGIMMGNTTRTNNNHQPSTTTEIFSSATALLSQVRAAADSRLCTLPIRKKMVVSLAWGTN